VVVVRIIPMTTQPASPPRPHRTARSAVPLEPALRGLRVEVARWALRSGQPLNLDAISVILGARHAEAIVEGRPFNRWTTNSVLTFLFGTADGWCARQGIPVPLHLGESLLTFVNFLAAEGVLATGSSPVRQLRTTISDLAGLTDSGHRRAARGGAAATAPTPLAPLT